MENTPKQITRSHERMHTKIDWLDSRHSFSFGGHYDPERMGFGPLRVVNDDKVVSGGGFPLHPHRDMEIISIVLDGQLEHKDSLGNGRVIKAGDIQYMSAGSGVMHSEFNPSKEKPVHFLQIWIEPNAKGLEPRYADQPIIGEVDNQWKLILSPDGREGSIAIRQDVELRTVQLSANSSIEYKVRSAGRGLWVFVLEGSVELASEKLFKGDSVAMKQYMELTVTNPEEQKTKLMLFEVPL